jgi:hypothetical protein
MLPAIERQLIGDQFAADWSPKASLKALQAPGP